MADFSIFEAKKATVEYMKLNGGTFAINIRVDSDRGNEVITIFSDKEITLESE